MWLEPEQKQLKKHISYIVKDLKVLFGQRQVGPVSVIFIISFPHF